MAKSPVWLRLSVIENAIDNLEMVSYFLENIESEMKWKWAVIALHQALYGFAISASSGFVQRKVTRPSKKYSDGKLISIWEAIDLVKKPADVAPEFHKSLVLSSDENWAVGKLVDEFRNEFEHFTPKSWSVEVSGMPKLISLVIRVIRFIALESNRVNSSISDEERIKIALVRVESILNSQLSNEANS